MIQRFIIPTKASRVHFGRRACFALLALSGVACSASDDGDEVADFSGGGTGASASNGNPAAGSPVSGAPAAASAATGSATPGSSNEVPGNLPVANAAAGPSSVGSAPGGAGGAGGSAMVSGAAASGGSAAAPQDPAAAGGAGGAAVTPPEPAPPAAPGGFYLLDDFEAGRDPQWTESEVGGGAGTFTIDTALGANGSSSSMRIDSNNAFHTMLQFALPQAVRDANQVFGRVFLRLAATPSQGHFIWVEIGNLANDQHEMRLGHNVGQLQSNHFLNGEQDIRDQSRQLVNNQWYCLEFQMQNDPDQLRVWLDGEETLLSTTNYTAGPGAQGNTNPLTDFIPPLEAFRIGWELQNGTVWFDDVALADARIGCQ